MHGPILRYNMQLKLSMEKDETWHMNMQIPALKYDAKQPQNMEKWHPMHEMKPATRN